MFKLFIYDEDLMNIFLKTYKKYRKGLILFCLLVVTILPVATSAATGINKQIPYQGTLKDSAGVNVSDGNYDMVFNIYNASSGGTTLWTGTHTTANSNAVSLSDGLFRVLLGSGTGNTMTLDFNDDTYWLGLTVGSDSEMTPRQRIGAAGYALNADTVDGTGFATSTFSTGDVLYYDGSDFQRLGIGTAGQFLKTNGGANAPEWVSGSYLQIANNLSDLINTSSARTSLGLVIGTDVQAYDAQLADVAGLAVTNGNFIVGDGTNFVAESGATVRTSLGIGTGDSPTFTGLTLTGNETINAQGDLRLADSDSSNYVGFQSPATVATNVVWTLPNADGSANQVLKTDGSGTLSWAAATNGGFSTTANITSNAPGTLATDNFVFGSDQLDDDGNTAHDSRMFFDKSKGAFRAGQVTGAQWDAVGVSSFASGQDTTASGLYSTAMGRGTTANNAYSTAMGYSTTASGSFSTAMGRGTTANNETSTAMGHYTTASGLISTTMGKDTTSQAYASVALGRYNIISGTTGTWIDSEPVFVIGNGTGAGNTANALTVLKNGQVGIIEDTPTALLHLGPTTASVAQIRLDSTAADPTSPNIGDLWFNGTNLNFRKDGTTTTDLLASGGTGDLLSTNNLSDLNSTSTARTNLGLAIGTDVQAYDSDLTTYAGITPSANIQSLLGSADYATARTNLGVAIGTDVQAYDSDLTTYAGITPSANIQTFLGSADYATARTNLGVAIGTDVQAYDAQLSDVAGLAVTNGNFIVGDGTNWVAETGNTARTSLGIGTGNSPTFTGLVLSGDLAVDSTTLYVDASANSVGIGTAAPTEVLHVSGGNVLIDRKSSTGSLTRNLTIGGARYLSGSDFASIFFQNYDSDSGGVDYIGAEISSQNDTGVDTGDLRFSVATNSTTLNEVLRIDSSGNVGIGDTTPDGKLEVRQTTTADIFNLYDNTTNVLSVLDGGDLAVDTDTLYVDASSNEVGIGVSNPGAKLHIRSSLGTLVYTESTKTTGSYYALYVQDGSGNMNGGINCDASGNTCTYITTSDRRIKENIRETHFSINDLMNINVSDYEIIDSGVSQTGLIAQDLYEIYPLAVSVGKDDITEVGGTWGVDYGRITPLIIKGVQDQQKQILQIGEQVEILQSELNSLTLDGTVDDFITEQENNGTLTANRIVAREELCIGEVGSEICLNKAELEELKALLGEGEEVAGNQLESSQASEPVEEKIVDEQNELDEPTDDLSDISQSEESIVEEDTTEESTEGDMTGEESTASAISGGEADDEQAQEDASLESVEESTEEEVATEDLTAQHDEPLEENTDGDAVDEAQIVDTAGNEEAVVEENVQEETLAEDIANEETPAEETAEDTTNEDLIE